MLKEISYTNHMNETLRLDTQNIFVQDCDLYDFSWNVNSKNNKISGFGKSVTQKTIALIIKGETEQKCIELRNDMFDVTEKDVLANKPGTMFVGRYFLKCFFTEVKKEEYIKESGFLRLTVKVATDTPYWTRETITTFGFSSGSAGPNLDFKCDFPADYTSNLLDTQLNNTSFAASNFIMRIYGSCDNPSVVIAGHEYNVSVTIAVNEYLTIDSVKKTVVLTKADGTKVNCFNHRNRDSYVFEKIPSGINSVLGGNFKFDVTLLDERSEPKWI